MWTRVVLAGALTMIGLAAPAHADPSADTAFLGALNNAGITYKAGPDAVAIGRRACQLMDQGHSEPDIAKSMSEQNAGFSAAAATRFTQIAESVYCPQHIAGGASAAQPAPQQPYYPAPEFPLPALPGAL
ncbi:DUF732 domain-containing protein [Candidatus Mycobacterium wuenschmannii]|uniref:DUF732 domain-containing protein n=1 Tax=Candidatus Mycobacterium wuenschmannii TaxID=3027808 RepID=A0ABY8W3T6_9MYCO|nr:DUF732 domain-containing protein [Candidatus Mycobacterium wuenschmannii]WIM89078.1 DUF732 domain-containing protein [Candidatus Mycobacterium wuenschmannii]